MHEQCSDSTWTTFGNGIFVSNVKVSPVAIKLLISKMPFVGIGNVEFSALFAFLDFLKCFKFISYFSSNRKRNENNREEKFLSKNSFVE